MAARIFYDSCPLCGSVNFKKSVIGDCSRHFCYKPIIPSKMQWMDCDNCSHQFIDGYFGEEALQAIFSDTLANQKIGYQMEQQRMLSSKIIEKVLEYQSTGIWLDVGFGNGSLIFTAQEYGFEAVGIDLRKKNVREIERLGFEAYCDAIENIHFKKKLTVISMMDVLEHMVYPKKILSNAFSKLKDGGCILLSMPNTENIVWKLLSEENNNPYLGELEHYHNFSRTRLFALLKECGFQPVRYGVSERYRVCMEVIAIKK